LGELFQKYGILRMIPLFLFWFAPVIFNKN
jgi:hypothetical protein